MLAEEESVSADDEAFPGSVLGVDDDDDDNSGCPDCEDATLPSAVRGHTTLISGQHSVGGYNTQLQGAFRGQLRMALP